jgi:subtilisin
MFKSRYLSFTVTLALILLIPISAIIPSSAAAAPPQMVQVIVGFADHGRAVQAVQNYGGNVALSYTLIPALLATVPENAITALDRNPNVRYVHENAVVEALAQSVPWGIERVNAPAAWVDSTGASVNVAILDTGVGTHRDLAVAGGINTIGGSSFADNNGHGTHVAGSAAAVNNTVDVVGVAFDANIYSVKVLDANGGGTINSIVLGIEWSVNNNMDIISMSLGTKSHYDALKEAVDNSYAAGLLNIAAAGNDGNPAGNGNNINYPARYDSVIAVGAVREDNLRASFSSTGPALEIMAPGQKVLSTYLNDSLKELSGTSMAAPHVSGVAALVWSANPQLANSEVRQILKDTAAPLGDASRYGHGIVNAQEAVRVAKESAGGTTDPTPEPSISVNIINPVNESTVQNIVTIQATVDSDAIASVDYTIVNQGITAAMSFNDTTGYWEADWDSLNVSDGSHTITVQAVDVDVAASGSVTVTVANEEPQQQPEPLQLSITVTTDKQVYQMGDRVYILTQVTDGTTAAAVSGASVSIEIVTASGRIYSGTGTTNDNGEITFNLKTKSPDGRGIYSATATASKVGYIGSNSGTTFEVR